jgi:anti-anti-sigma regulatory factor
MLKITMEKNPRITTLRLEGKLSGPWVDELERSWRAVSSRSADCPVAVDLTDVTFVSEEGKKLLEAMYGEGARLKGSGCVTRRLVEEIGNAFSRIRPKQPVPTAE